MRDILLRIEEACLGLDILTLLVPGLLAIGVGLLLWLGGRRYARLTAGLLGALAGAWLGMLVSDFFDVSLLAGAGTGAVVIGCLAALMRKIVIIGLAAIIFAIALGSGYIGYVVNDSQWQQGISDLKSRLPAEGIRDADLRELTPAKLAYLRQLLRQKESLLPGADITSHHQAVEKLKTTAAELRLSAADNRGVLIVMIVLGAIVGIVLAYILGTLIMSLCCSVVGSAAVIGGMCALLLAKETEVISALLAQPRVIGIVFGGMVAFGCIVQLLHAMAARTKAAVDADESED